MTTAAETTHLEELRAFNRTLEQVLAQQPPAHLLAPEVTRRARREGRGIFPPPVFLPDARDLEVAGRAGPIRLRVISPRTGTSRGAYLHIHGGGFVLGAADLQDAALQDTADATGLTAVSVDYRLAPEHPFPAGPDDCEDAALWLIGHGTTELGVPARFTIGGESAGGYLAALTLLRLRDRDGRHRAFAGANLVYGVYDQTMTPSQRLWGDRYLVLSTPLIEWFAECFLPGMDMEARRAPSVSPLYADLRDMPPAHFTIGTLDPLVDDTLFMEARWRSAGNTTQLLVVEEGVHGFTMYPVAAARSANERAAAFLSSVIG
jgi:acetyl esterase/lipase